MAILTLYDTDTGENGLALKAISSATWRIRLILNYKNIPHETVWLPYAKIAPTIKALGAPSSGYLPDGTERYTVPTIVDVDGTVVSDSFKIAEYLEHQYPRRPLFPIGTRALQAHFASNFDSPTGLGASFAPLLFPRVLRSMEPTDLAYFDKLWSSMFGVPTLTALSDTADKRNAAWKNIDAALSALSQIYDHADGAVFLGGECPLYADFLVAATLVTVRLVFERGVGNGLSKERGTMGPAHGCYRRLDYSALIPLLF